MALSFLLYLVRPLFLLRKGIEYGLSFLLDTVSRAISLLLTSLSSLYRVSSSLMLGFFVSLVLYPYFIGPYLYSTFQVEYSLILTNKGSKRDLLVSTVFLRGA